MITLTTTATIDHKFDELEIHPCKEFEKGTKDAFVEQVEPEDAEFWSVYVHFDASKNEEGFGGLECIADCDTKEEAEELVTFLKQLAKQNEIKG